jgi:hypothetical protein
MFYGSELVTEGRGRKEKYTKDPKYALTPAYF